MELYVGMDVSLKETSICVVDGSGKAGGNVFRQRAEELVAERSPTSPIGS